MGSQSAVITLGTRVEINVNWCLYCASDAITLCAKYPKVRYRKGTIECSLGKRKITIIYSTILNLFQIYRISNSNSKDALISLNRCRIHEKIPGVRGTSVRGSSDVTWAPLTSSLVQLSDERTREFVAKWTGSNSPPSDAEVRHPQSQYLRQHVGLRPRRRWLCVHWRIRGIETGTGSWRLWYGLLLSLWDTRMTRDSPVPDGDTPVVCSARTRKWDEGEVPVTHAPQNALHQHSKMVGIETLSKILIVKLTIQYVYVIECTCIYDIAWSKRKPIIAKAWSIFRPNTCFSPKHKGYNIHFLHQNFKYIVMY